jgi:hypothetical protein
MSENRRRFEWLLTDRNISLVIRWWAAGAVYFFIGWGTGLGNQQSLIDFAFTLGVVIGLGNILILNPVLRMLFNRPSDRPPGSNTYSQRISDYLVELIKSVVLVVVVALIYMVINSTLIRVFGLADNAVPLPGEPILFGVFYVIVFVVFEKILALIKQTILRLRHGADE